jgi:serine/threonine protein kinase
MSSMHLQSIQPFGSQVALSIPGYEIRELIGVGGMGRVDKAWQSSLQRWVAIKSIPTRGPDGRSLGEQLKREALATSSLSHPNIIKIFEVATSEDSVFLVLEWVDGVNLRELLENGPVELDTAVDIIRQIVAALHHAHERGIIHRDIKPSNILINDDGHIWVADFGIASVRTSNVIPGTKADQTLLHAGSAAYMAPERLRQGVAASPQEDVYSLAALFYELLMAHTPQGVFPPLASRNPEWSALDAVISRALAHAPENRHSDVTTFWADLKAHYKQTAETFWMPYKGLLPASQPLDAMATTADPSPPISLWVLLGLGLVFFFFQTALIGFSSEEQFSFPAGPGSKLYDSAMALTTLNGLFVSCWSAVLYLTWRRCRSHPDAPTHATLLLCYLPIVIGITTIVYMAVSD